MAFLKKEQYEYRREAAAERNMRNELKAVDNGMTAKQAELISELCSLRHKLHCSMDSIVKDNDGDIYKRFVSLEERMEESGLPELGGSRTLEEMDDMDGLIFYYGEDVPQDHDSAEFQEWYKEEYSRIYDELSDVNDTIEKYLKKIDDKYKTSFCPTGTLRAF